MRNLFATVMLSAIFSLLSACLFVTMNAVDVAFTEAAVGAGIATLLFLGTLALTTREERPRPGVAWYPFLIVMFTGALLIYGTMDMPPFGDAAAPVHGHVTERYVMMGPVETGVPNMVTAVLASYRGYDTLGEVIVIYTAGIGVLLLLGRGRRSPRPRQDV